MEKLFWQSIINNQKLIQINYIEIDSLVETVSIVKIIL